VAQPLAVFCVKAGKLLRGEQKFRAAGIVGARQRNDSISVLVKDGLQLAKPGFILRNHEIIPPF
jgi:hypothetical protein